MSATGKNAVVSPRTVFTDPVHFLAFGFGSGLSPFAPGTAGTIVAIPLWLLLVQWPFWAYVAATLLVTLAGFWICGESAKRLGVHDHGGIVWDEIAGFLITMIAVPLGWEWVLAGFLLFRFFDIVKPWPARWFDTRVENGVGIVMDDVVAGVYACLLLNLLAMIPL